MNTVDRGQASVDDVLTPRLAARFERVLAADESGGVRDATRRRADRLGPGLFELALRARAEPVTTARAPVLDATSLLALGVAVHACGQEILAAAERWGDDGNEASVIDASAEVRLARVAADATSIEALLDGAIAVCNEIAVSAGTDATLAWFVRVAPAIDRLERLALGVVVAVPDRGPSTRRPTTTLGEQVVAARARIAARLRARDELARLEATRATAIETAAAAARVAIAAAIDAELASANRATETRRANALAEVEEWLADERRRVEATAHAVHQRARDAADSAQRAALDAAHADRLAELAQSHARAMEAVDVARATYDAAVVHRHDEVDALRARWERRLEELAGIEEARIRMLVAQEEHRLHGAALAAALARAANIDEEARRVRDAAIAGVEAAEAAERARSEARYRARLAAVERARHDAERAADHALAQASSELERVAAVRRSSIERDAGAAARAAHAHAAARREREVEDGARAAARATARELEEQVAALAAVARGGRDD